MADTTGRPTAPLVSAAEERQYLEWNVRRRRVSAVDVGAMPGYPSLRLRYCQQGRRGRTGRRRKHSRQPHLKFTPRSPTGAASLGPALRTTMALQDHSICAVGQIGDRQ
jgi:hypothetical protein